ncbi:hypothetical protein CkaCkLH20_04769 [Colletotrichum karsti]|uniref:Uncharacterized protein n=1 Tax=Colletotrichum karsti TaxID=1095194 RepID=A0A9P6LIT7_9PEZI|nr:uncharacterized protein CkaCkLH20_04769 [Colletotrichum karsti]KAF9877634.1 hypothetical protein CkaCkLH20_04769 [Colletotrichum karsti]
MQELMDPGLTEKMKTVYLVLLAAAATGPAIAVTFDETAEATAYIPGLHERPDFFEFDSTMKDTFATIRERAAVIPKPATEELAASCRRSFPLSCTSDIGFKCALKCMDPTRTSNPISCVKRCADVEIAECVALGCP